MSGAGRGRDPAGADTPSQMVPEKLAEWIWGGFMGKEWTEQYQCQTQGRREVSWRSDNSSDLRGWWRWDPPPAPAKAPRQESQVPPGKEAMSLISGVCSAQLREQRTGKWGKLVLGTSFKHVARSPTKKCQTMMGREFHPRDTG